MFYIFCYLFIVQAEVEEDLKVEEAFESKKFKLAELGNALLTDPESNIKDLKEMVQLSKDNDRTIVKLGLLSLLAVFRDIIPGYAWLTYIITLILYAMILSAFH